MSRSESSESAFEVASTPMVSSRGLDVALRTAGDGLLLSLVGRVCTACSDLALDVSEGRSDDGGLPLLLTTLVVDGEVAPGET